MQKNPSTFFFKDNFDEQKVVNVVNNAISKLDDGELFLEYSEAESIVLDDGKIKNSSFNISSGFGLRGIVDETVSYAYSSDLSLESLSKSAEVITGISGNSRSINLDKMATNFAKLYPAENPIKLESFESKIKLLKEIDHYLRSKSPMVKQVTASLASSWQVVSIVKPGNEIAYDVRPLVRVNVSVVVEKGGKMEGGSYGTGGRTNFADFIQNNKWQKYADEAFRQACVLLEARPAPAGEMKVVLGPGWPGVLLHEAVGHGLEGDFNRKKTSAFSDMLGKRVASPGVTVIDDGTLQNRRGSISIDDEGAKSQKTVLIEDGILKGYMQDSLNARLMNMARTGNGRRESYAHQPMPRMTNTYMLGGDHSQEEIIASVEKGIFAANFGGGQVDITSGKFVFSASEAYLIENGKVTAPIKGATLIGNGPDCLTKVKMIGNDMCLDAGVGTCGKNGQSVPVGVGQPSMLIDSITVGGTEM
ncbi:metalloprotease TldD [Rickettsiales endosymbiont of Stachyamoeba lipophora]|uniref:metalloprotease TldD n=1 Tax=Rickettsiales endosymbiont of Stachyamoeba lipophora TaxID=2486578 RepID=UPI000F64618F|nr:metalloprotease TldD [Rickettsiales endosymbiont of Stachyamoeba lipophora]AZL15325.1 metalloprotease TldD [Rickettsiales endosymbiont of Stachyamoeba lipophora]